ncbi:MAG: DUF779 domain-containing protein [Myxococcota bacterium]
MAAGRVDATEAALALVAELVAEHGPVMFHQSGGCCDGSSPMCFPVGDFKIGAHDVLLGTIGGAEVWIGGRQYEAWAHTALILDVVPGRGAGFSLEAPRGVRFVTRSRVLGDDELCALPPPRRGADPA